MFNIDDIVKVTKLGSSKFGQQGTVKKANPAYGFELPTYLVKFDAGDYRTYFEDKLELVESDSELESFEAFKSKVSEVGLDGFDALGSFETPAHSQVAEVKEPGDINIGVEFDISTDPLDKLVEAINFIGNALVNFGNDVKAAAEKFEEFKNSLPSEVEFTPEAPVDNN